jgi:hypothetical protein
MIALRIAGIFFALQFVPAAESSALVLCTTPDGKTYAGDAPPPNCKIKSEYTTSSEPPTPQEALDADISNQKTAEMNAFDAKAISIRRSLERTANDAAEELEETRRKLAAVPVVNPVMYENSAYGWQRYEEDLHAREMLISSLRQREAELVGKINGAWQAFGDLTTKVAKAHGGMAPPSWAPLRCEKCP